jgi:cellulose biosynthesis protein BcsQ
MAKIITLLSKKSESGNTTIAFNIAQILKNNQKRVLIINLGFNQTYFDILKIKSGNLKTKEVVSPFSYINYSKNLQIMFLVNNPSKTYMLEAEKYEALLRKQIEEWGGLFDFIIFDTSHTYHFINEIALKLSHQVVVIFDANNFINNDVLNILKDIRTIQLIKSKLEIRNVILNRYSNKNVDHVNTLIQLKHTFDRPNLLMTLPIVKELSKLSVESLEYSLHNQ